MRITIIAIIILLVLCVSGLAAAQKGQDLMQQGLGMESAGNFDSAIKIYQRIVRDFSKDRALVGLVAKAKVHLGDCLIRSGEARGLDVLKDVINNYPSQTAEVNEARRLIALSRPFKLTLHDYLLVAEFKNSTGDPIFDDSLRTALIFHLEPSPFFDIFPYNLAQRALVRAGRPKDTRLTHAEAQNICQKGGVLLPSIDGSDGRYIITLEVVSCAGLRTTPARMEASSRDEVLGQLARTAAILRANLGEPPESIRRNAPPTITTKSFDALAAFAQGYKQRVTGDLGRAQLSFQRAVKIDDKFASAYSFIATIPVDNKLARSSATKAYELRAQVSEKEKLTIEARYQDVVIGDVGKAIGTLEHLRDLYPGDADFRSFLGNEYRALGLFEKGLRELQEAVQRNPTDSTAFGSLIRNYMELNNFTEAKAVYKAVVNDEVDSFDGIHRAAFAMAVADGNPSAAQQQLDWGNAKGPQIQQDMRTDQALAAAFHGNLESAQNTLEAQLRSNATAAAKASLISGAARAQAIYGNAAESQTLVERMMGIRRSPQELAAAVVVYGLAGNAEIVKTLASEIKSQYPDDTFMNFIWIPTALAALEIQKGNGTEAIKLLEPAAAYEPSANSMWAIYVRGLAYLQSGSGRAAATEFQKIIDHRGVDLLSPLLPMSQLRLAEAAVLMNDVPQARKRYQDFFTSWKGADPGLPVLRDANTKYAALPAN